MPYLNICKNVVFESKYSAPPSSTSILMIPSGTEHVTVSSVVGNELIEDEYDMSDIKKAFLNPEEKEHERRCD